MFKAFSTILRWIFTPLMALILLFEEWGWVPLAAIVSRLARLPVWTRLEQTISRLPPWAALLVLVLPSFILLPVKLLALYFLGKGQAAVGMGILVTAKLLGTALLARLFQVTQPALMQLAWFAHWYPRWKAWKDGLMESMRASKLWRAGRAVKAKLRRLGRQFWTKS